MKGEDEDKVGDEAITPRQFACEPHTDPQIRNAHGPDGSGYGRDRRLSLGSSPRPQSQAARGGTNGK